jgi:hypothetical protein
MSGNWAAPNPPYGAVFTYNVSQALPGDAKLVLTITDDAGKQVRRLNVSRVQGLQRVAWNLRADPPPAGQNQGRAGGFGGRGGPPQGPVVEPGRYRATLGRLAGDTVTPLGPSQDFSVLAPEMK